MDLRFEDFLQVIKELPRDCPLTKEDLVTEQFLLERSGQLEVYYAPHNEYINRKAKVIIVGITPGWQQMKTAFEQVVKGLALGYSCEQVLLDAKRAASFAGSMRTNLITMLDQSGLPEALGVASSAALFQEKRSLLHTTSVIKYPTFYRGRNYTGYQPQLERSVFLSELAYTTFPKELEEIERGALVIPLGKMVKHVLIKLKQSGELSPHIILSGFPHPSGANGHRNRQFLERLEEFRAVVKEWAGG